ncbi:hypothetical protein BAG01nite_38530 [Brevibacillus agri]|uniref:Uncharacterized protein n=1 Tax=Brevibacillus agri TaxID=51101 RepID=A0A3M8BAT0_9BACL|nr:hypothetical protein [Brevibacillus agri]QAV11451.1 hypothetical protein BA6348_00745 [Brevibacillus agri]RNB60538.1 hypothetical protein EB820_03165 [Brevibacillus agri]GED27751.1 hypothetical protein BAG01nite_38530 [Brevibacillus agri]
MRLLDSYLELGVVGMARAAQAGWFGGHYGAALLAGYYMDREHELPEHVKAGIERTCEAFRRLQPEWFAPLGQEEQADPALLQQVVDGLTQNVKQLRTSGHGLALGVLALKALRDRPDLVRPSVVAGLVEMLKKTTEDRPTRYWGIDSYFAVTTADVAEEVAPYDTTEEMARRTFAELHTVVPGRVIDGQRYHFAGEIVHGVTHAQALTDLERFGYGELVQAGMVNHRIQTYLNRQMPEFVLADEVKEPAFTEIFSPAYWEKTYSDPHALKLPYAALDLLGRLPAGERPDAERNLCKLLTTME